MRFPATTQNQAMTRIAKIKRAKITLRIGCAKLPCHKKVALAETHHVSINEKFLPIRKGLLEFLLLKIIAAEKVYVADILEQLRETEFATQEGTLYPLLSKMRR